MFACQNQGGSCFSVKRVLFSIGILFLCGIGGCKNNEEPQAFMGMKPDEYFVCSYENTSEDDGKKRENGTVVINSKGDVEKTFSGGYVDKIITKDGYIVGKKNGIISKDETLILSLPKGDGSYSTGVYETGKEQWLIEPGELRLTSFGVDGTGRLDNINIGPQMYDRFFEKISSYEETRQCYGDQELRNETDINGITKIVDKEGKTVLTAEEFYKKNASLITKPQTDPENIVLYDVYNSDCWQLGYKEEDGYYYANCLCTSDGKIIEIEGLDYLNIHAGFQRFEHSWNADSCYSDRYLKLLDYDSDGEWILKLDGASVRQLYLPESEEIDYEGQDLFVLQDNNTYQIYDAKKEKVSCKIQTQEDALFELILIGPESYIGRFLRQSTDNPEDYKSICKFLIGGKEKIIDYTDYIGTEIIGNGYSVIVIKEDGKETSFIVYEDGSYNKKMDKKVLWADKENYLSYENNTFSFYSREDKLVKNVKIEN